MSDRAIKPRRHRLEVRVTPEQDALIRQAADLEDTTVTAFDRFIAELDKPAQPVPELVDLFTFDSGSGMLDGWLRRHALAAQRMDSARTFVATRGGGVVGYFSLTMGSVLRADAPAKLVRGMPAHPVGMVLLGRLAVDQSQQGKGVGAMLLAEAL